jgi:hypothetical protein
MALELLTNTQRDARTQQLVLTEPQNRFRGHLGLLSAEVQGGIRTYLGSRLAPQSGAHAFLAAQHTIDLNPHGLFEFFHGGSDGGQLSLSGAILSGRMQEILDRVPEPLRERALGPVFEAVGRITLSDIVVKELMTEYNVFAAHPGSEVVLFGFTDTFHPTHAMDINLGHTTRVQAGLHALLAESAYTPMYHELRAKKLAALIESGEQTEEVMIHMLHNQPGYSMDELDQILRR